MSKFHIRLMLKTVRSRKTNAFRDLIQITIQIDNIYTDYQSFCILTANSKYSLEHIMAFNKIPFF